MALPADLNSVNNPTPGQPIPAAWGDLVRTWVEFLVDPPACSIKESTAQLTPDDSLTALTSNEENYDNDSMHSTSSNTSRITIQTPGRYVFSAIVEFAANATGHRQFEFLVNGATSYGVIRAQAVTTGNGTFISGTRTLVLAATDYVELRALQTSGGVLGVTMLEYAAYFITR